MKRNEEIDYYLDKISNSGRLKFLKIINLPQNSTLHVLFILIIFALMEAAFSLYFIPSLFAIYLLWKYLNFLEFELQIAEDCVVDEYFMGEDLKNNTQIKNTFPDAPLYVTEEDRDYIVDKIINEKKSPDFFDKIRGSGVMFLLCVFVYLVIYGLLSFVLF